MLQKWPHEKSVDMAATKAQHYIQVLQLVATATSVSIAHAFLLSEIQSPTLLPQRPDSSAAAYRMKAQHRPSLLGSLE